MAISVKVSKDLSKIKTKVALNLTKRQLICFGIGIAISIPVFFLSKKAFGMEGGVFTCMCTAFPFFLFGMYEKNGVPAEKLLFYAIMHDFLRVQVRPKDESNRFEREEKEALIRKEILELENKAAKKKHKRD